MRSPGFNSFLTDIILLSVHREERREGREEVPMAPFNRWQDLWSQRLSDWSLSHSYLVKVDSRFLAKWIFHWCDNDSATYLLSFDWATPRIFFFSNRCYINTMPSIPQISWQQIRENYIKYCSMTHKISWLHLQMFSLVYSRYRTKFLKWHLRFLYIFENLETGQTFIFTWLEPMLALWSGSQHAPEMS